MIHFYKSPTLGLYYYSIINTTIVKHYSLILFFSFIFTLTEISAQNKLEFHSFEESVFDISASMNQKTDINGEPAALLKIIIPRLKGFTVESPIRISQEEDNNGETLVYLGDRSIKVTVRHPDFLPFKYKFKKPLQGKHVYTLTLQVPSSYLPEAYEKVNQEIRHETLLKEAYKLQEEGEEEKALAIYQQISDNPEAQLQIGHYHYRKKMSKEALKWYNKAAEQGNVSAQSCLGTMYYLGDQVEKDDNESMKWFRKAAEQGDAYSQNYLACGLITGTGIERDNYEAAKWFRLSADQGYMEAQFFMGYLFESEIGVPKDYKEAFKWYSKAADQGDYPSYHSLGKLYEEGKGISRNYEKAVELYQKAVEHNYSFAQYRLGKLYEEGKGVEQNYAMAAVLYAKAAQQEYDEAQYQLGRLYDRGKGVEQNYIEAFQLYKKAAEQGHLYAQYYLGLDLTTGRGCQQDVKSGIECFVKAAEGGHKESRKVLDMFHDKGDEEAVKQLKKRVILASDMYDASSFKDFYERYKELQEKSDPYQNQ